MRGSVVVVRIGSGVDRRSGARSGTVLEDGGGWFLDGFY